MGLGQVAGPRRTVLLECMEKESCEGLRVLTEEKTGHMGRFKLLALIAVFLVVLGVARGGAVHADVKTADRPEKPPSRPRRRKGRRPRSSSALYQITDHGLAAEVSWSATVFAPDPTLNEAKP